MAVKLRRIQWAAVVCVLVMIAAVVAVGLGQESLGVVLGLCSIALALLSLKEDVPA